MAPMPGREGPAREFRVFLVDDHRIVLEGLLNLINQEANLSVCGQALDSQEALKNLAGAKPDLVILDIALKSGSGLELIKALKVRSPHLPILVLSMHNESLYAERALRAGAKGYIMKEEGTEKLVTAIHRVLDGQIYLSESMTTKLLSQRIQGRSEHGTSSLDVLSDRELEVFHLIGQGRSTREIAEQLHLSVKTVESYRENIKEKLRLQNATELIQHAIHWLHDQAWR
jgi:DNA-binding NarL/FixJ family response regulator